MKDLVATRYAEAFFELGLEEKLLDVFKKDLELIKEVVLNSLDLQKVLKHPEITREEKSKVLLTVFDGMHEYTLNFLKVIVQKERCVYLSDICDAYVELLHEHNQEEVAYVKSANVLTNKERDAIYHLLKKKRKKEIICEYTVDESLIAGVRIQMKDDVLDNSIATQLLMLKENVKKAIF